VASVRPHVPVSVPLESDTRNMIYQITTARSKLKGVSDGIKADLEDAEHLERAFSLLELNIAGYDTGNIATDSMAGSS
jgi:hypothetical protein